VAISLVAVSSSTLAGTTSLAPAVPTGTINTSNDVAFICIANKLSSATPSTPSGWTSVGSVTVGTGTDGVGTGLVRLTIFFIQVPAGFTAPTVSIASGNSAIGTMIALRPATGSVIQFADLVTTSGSDTTSGTAYSATGAADVGFAPGDYALLLTGLTVNTTVTAVGGTISFGGATPGAINTRTLGTANGNDIGFSLNYVNIASGTSSSAPTSIFTLAGASTGGTLWVRARETVSFTTYSGAASLTATATLSSSGALVSVFRQLLPSPLPEL
jgi:hypothetical protein